MVERQYQSGFDHSVAVIDRCMGDRQAVARQALAGDLILSSFKAVKVIRWPFLFQITEPHNISAWIASNIFQPILRLLRLWCFDPGMRLS